MQSTNKSKIYLCRHMTGLLPLTLAWLCGAAIFTCFRWLEKLQADTLLVIVVNYYVAAGLGWAMAGGWSTFEEAWPAPWVLTAMAAGAAFLYLFHFMAEAARKIGVTVTSVAAKLSMILPVAIFLAFDSTDHLTWTKSIALLLTLPAIVLSSWSKNSRGFDLRAIRIPLIIFFGGGCIDLMFGWFSGPEHMAGDAQRYLFTTLPFTIAGLIGTVILFIRKRPEPRPTPRRTGMTVAIGTGLGIINLGSLYYLLESYAQLPLDRSAVTPSVNLGIIVLSALAAVLLFREQLNRANRWGLFLACAAIALLAI